MNFNKVDVDKNIMLNFIKNNNLNVNDLLCYSNLYQNYNFILNLLNKHNNDFKVLLDYENKIYTINGKKMFEEQKIEYEFSRIEKKILNSKDNLSTEEYELVLRDMSVLKKIYDEYIKNKDKTTLHYIKKSISSLQARLGLKNYFLMAAYDVFLEKYMDLCINNKKYSLEKNN